MSNWVGTPYVRGLFWFSDHKVKCHDNEITYVLSQLLFDITLCFDNLTLCPNHIHLLIRNDDWSISVWNAPSFYQVDKDHQRYKYKLCIANNMKVLGWKRWETMHCVQNFWIDQIKYLRFSHSEYPQEIIIFSASAL